MDVSRPHSTSFWELRPTPSYLSGNFQSRPDVFLLEAAVAGFRFIHPFL